MKKESFAKEMFQELNILRLKENDIVLVGDSLYDVIGATNAGIDFIAVSYCFGFKTFEDAQTYHLVAVIFHSKYLIEKVI